MIDARLNFKQQAQHVATKASVIRASLSRLMPNIGGPKQKRRSLLMSVVTSVITYGIPIWAEALKLQDVRRKIAPVYRLCALRIASAFRTVSEDAVCAIAGVLPIEILAEERKTLYYRKATSEVNREELTVEERRNSLLRWQKKWNTSTKGRWTYRLIPELDVWINRSHGEVNYYLTQLISGHGCYREYLHRFKHEDSPECPSCAGVNEDAEHVFFKCPRFDDMRATWEDALQQNVRPESLIKAMLSSEASWQATNDFASEVLQELRRLERQRKTLA